MKEFTKWFKKTFFLSFPYSLTEERTKTLFIIHKGIDNYRFFELCSVYVFKIYQFFKRYVQYAQPILIKQKVVQNCKYELQIKEFSVKLIIVGIPFLPNLPILCVWSFSVFKGVKR